MKILSPWRNPNFSEFDQFLHRCFYIQFSFLHSHEFHCSPNFSFWHFLTERENLVCSCSARVGLCEIMNILFRFLRVISMWRFSRGISSKIFTVGIFIDCGSAIWIRILFIRSLLHKTPGYSPQLYKVIISTLWKRTGRISLLKSGIIYWRVNFIPEKWN